MKAAEDSFDVMMAMTVQSELRVTPLLVLTLCYTQEDAFKERAAATCLKQ